MFEISIQNIKITFREHSIADEIGIDRFTKQGDIIFGL